MLPPFAVYSAQGAKQAARDTRLHDAQRPKPKAKAKKRTDIENELLRHADLISDTKVKAFIMKKREKQLELRQEKYAKEAKYSAMRKDVEMLVEESEEDEDIKALAKVKKTKAIKKK